MKSPDVTGNISMADMIVMSSILDVVSMFVTDALEVIDDASLARMIRLRSSSNDISTLANDLLDVVDGI